MFDFDLDGLDDDVAEGHSPEGGYDDEVEVVW